MSSSKDNTHHRKVVLLVGAVAGGLYGLLRMWPADWVRIAGAIIAMGIAWAAYTYWAFVWLRPRRTRGTPIGAMIGAAITLVVYSVLPDLDSSTGLYGKVVTVIGDVVFGALIGALVGTAPRGYEYNPVIVFIGAAIIGLLFGGGIGAYFELGRRSTVTKPHP